MTTTMVETFDTQMLDYQNDDYSMHVSSSDTWFHDEAIMEDDGLPVDDANVSIEVDMEPYDEDRNTEYEMVDGSENYDLQSSELLDVEVYDASRATTPTVILAVDTPTRPHSEVADDSHLAHEFVEPSVSILDHGPLPLTEHQATSVANDNTLVSDVAVSSTLPPYPQPGEEFAGITSVELPDALRDRAPSPTNVELDHDHSVATRPSLETTAIVTEQDLADSREQGPVTDGQEAESGDIVQPDYEDQSGPVEGSIFHQPNLNDDTEGAEEHGDYESGVSSGDPHEISEGVFIDPPPAVLLSIALDNQPEISLFNAPSRPEAASPSSGELHSDVPVLLSHLPILYYEPLSSVFEALRQDEHIANIDEFINAELALNAYDLEVVLSEDNIYAREVSLHDLNELHDGFNYSGPLRLRLQTTGPRFSTQYRTLREHVARLNISEAKDDGLESTGNTSEAKQMHIQHSIKEQAESLESEEHEQDSITTKSIQEQQQEADHNETTEGTDVEAHHVVSTTSEQGEYHSNDNEDLENQQEQDGVGASEPNYGDPTDKKDEYSEESVHQAGPEDNSTVLGGETDAGQEEDPDAYYVIESHDTHGETAPDQESGSTSESHVQEALYNTEDSNANSGDALDHTPRISELHVSSFSATDNDAEGSEQGHPSLGAEDLLKETDSGRPNLESLPDIDASEFDFNDEHGANENKNQASLSRQEVLPITEALHQENDEYNAEPWDDDLDGEGDPDILWEHEQETASNQSSVTLSSKTSSKRSISEAEFGDNHGDLGSPPYSPGLKRPRVQ